MTRIRPLLALMLLAFWAVASGCGRRTETQTQAVNDSLSSPLPADAASVQPPASQDPEAQPAGEPTATTPSAPESAPPPPPSAMPAMPQDVIEIRAGIRAQQSALERAARAGDLAATRAPALRLRDLAVALQGRTKGVPAADLAQLEQSVGDITTTADALRQHAERGDLAAVRADVAALGQSVAALLRVTRRAT
jgi:hypothetical protein